jgi:penicillin-binding protein 2
MSRIRAAQAFLLAIFFILGLALFYFGGLQGAKYRLLSRKNCIRLLARKGCRGRILDRSGQVIVDSRLSYELLVAGRDKEDADTIITAVSKVLGRGPAELKSQYQKNYLAPSLPVAVARNISLKEAIALGELRTDYPGIIIHPCPVRHYPYGRLGAHVIGYLSEVDRWRLTNLADYGYKTKDIVGFGGVEEKYDYYLRQEEGGLSFEVDHRGKFVRTVGFRSPRNGRDIQLTLDLAVQKIAEDAFSNLKGCVIIMDPYSGEIIAMVSSPGFNPRIFVNNSFSSAPYIFSDPAAPLVNRAISGVYPPGSIFKIIVAAAALEARKITPQTSFLCQGWAFVGSQRFNCWDVHNLQNLTAGVAHSCNVFFYRTGLLAGAQIIYEYALKFGLAKPTAFELPYEAGGFIPSPLWRRINRFRNWYAGDTANLSIGQGEVLVTPLQMTRMIAVFANQGYLVRPYIVRSIGGRDVSSYQKKISSLNLRQDTIDYIRAGLKEVVNDLNGTGHVLSALPVAVAGKTGTAQVSRGQPHGWFVGFFPFKEPKYVICVFLENGIAGYYACVAGKQIIEKMAAEGLI